MGVRLVVRSAWAPAPAIEAVYEFDQSRITIGRGRGADVRLPHRAVSVRHATIEHASRGYTIVDHETTNGTAVGGARVVAGRPKPLRHGDTIELGGFVITFLANVPVTTATSAERTASLARRLARDALDAEAGESTPSLVVLNGPMEGTRLTLPEPPSRLVIGRGESCDLTLDDADLSREHAEVEVGLDGVWLRDLDSKNGVWLGERRVEARLLDDRDEVRLGATMLRFDDPAAAPVEALDGGDDLAVEPPRLPAPPEPAPEPAEPPPPPDEAAAPPASSPRPSPRARGGSIAPADMVIYVLASAVFALSILGLLWLLRSG